MTASGTKRRERGRNLSVQIALKMSEYEQVVIDAAVEASGAGSRTAFIRDVAVKEAKRINAEWASERDTRSPAPAVVNASRRKPVAAAEPAKPATIDPARVIKTGDDALRALVARRRG